MSPEFLVLFVTLLWGPTGLWLIYRQIRGHRGRLPERFNRSQQAPDELEAPVDEDGFWACGSCHSLNRGEANRCYRCGTATGSAGRQEPGGRPVSPGIPVMAEVVVRSSGGRPVGPGIPVMAEVVARSSGGRPVGPGIPVMAEAVARSSADAVATPVALATPGIDPPAPELLVLARESTLPTVPPEASAATPVCPFLGLKHDPSTRYDFPDPTNHCHATTSRGATSVTGARRSITGLAGARRPQPIGAEHQASCCLTAAHRQCARYPASRVGSSDPGVDGNATPPAQPPST